MAEVKPTHLAEFIHCLWDAPAAKTHDDAFALLADCLNAVEDKMTDIPFDPDAWLSDGRMYPPQDEIYRVAETAARRVAQLCAHAADDGVAAVLTLADIRALAGFTQVQVASALRIKQPTVQRTERRQNIQMDTLANYAEAMGGRLAARLVFDEMEVRIMTYLLRSERRFLFAVYFRFSVRTLSGLSLSGVIGDRASIGLCA